ncbi:molybdopterin-dependent oxidoreductase [Thermoproteus tenax]|uniref:Formate dehydrogenase alpha subunit n=1 Tax=Thermoproteus tenax (strain ATCC 35583 / DSM 2078 / JCM 9277 / NBRC 100435 / Kra 1) TaxID=768679 RepID=G4RJU8_THETK|nr:molybdopterin-dependent oxidoreductase [Thermoproteus tenax]CCC81843.1 formate dehydrogenase alpha subunit [Thermoproteus tenax Kra 1]
MTVSTTRRGFLKISALAALALGLPSSAQSPLILQKTSWTLGEIGGKSALTRTRVTPVICPFCSMGCSIDFYTAGNDVVWTSGSSDSYINWGALCPKGKVAYQLVTNPKRLDSPMIRTGPKPPVEEILSAKTWDDLVAVVKRYPPQWEKVSWEEAFTFIARRLASILNQWRNATGAPVQKDGYYYVGTNNPVMVIGSSILTNEEAYLSRKLAAFLGTSNTDSQYRKCHSSTVTALALTYGWGAETASIEDVALADVVLFFSSPAEAHPLSFYYFLKGKRERGTILITFDPRYSRTAEASDIWVPFRPGTDTAILNYILHYAFFERNPPIDQLPEFQRLMAQRWNITQDDLEDLKALISEYDLQTVANITGAPPDLLRTVASIFVENSGVVTGHKKHGVIQWAMGFTQHTDATLSIIRAAAIVQLLLGNVGYPGGGTHPFRGHSNVQGATDVQGGGLGVLPGYHAQPATSFDVRLYQEWKLQGMPDAWNWEVPDWALKSFSTSTPSRGAADVAKALAVYNFYGWRRFELLWGIYCGTIPPDDPVNGKVVCDIPFGTGYSEVTFIRNALAGKINAALIFAENPAVTNPNVKLVMAALSSLQLLVLTDIFETETAWFADVVLPGAAFAEKEGTRTDGNRVIQWTWRAVPPRGEARPDYWIIAGLYKYLRKEGAVLLPSEVAGVNKEEVKFRKRGNIIFVYERPLRPDHSWDYSGGVGSSAPISDIEAEVNPRIITKEINYAVMIYQGIYDPVRDSFTPMRRSNELRKPGEIDGTFSSTFKVYKNWGWSWPMNVRFMYNFDSLEVILGKPDVVNAAGQQWTVTGETGEIIDEYTGEYRPAFVPGHNFFAPKTFKRRLSGVADLFGGLDLMKFIRTGEKVFLGKFVVETDTGVQLVDFDSYAAMTGMRYLWANDALYWDQETLSDKAFLKRVFYPGSGWRQFKPTYEKMRSLLKQYYQQLGDLKAATLKVIQEMGGWYKGYTFQWPIHAEPVESPVTDMAISYPTLAWLNPYNLMVLNNQPDVVSRGMTGVALDPKELQAELQGLGITGITVALTSNRLTEHWHSGSMTRNIPDLVELVPRPFAIVSKSLAQQLGINSGDYVEIWTARGGIKLRAFVTDGEAYVSVNGQTVPVVNVVWSWSFQGTDTGASANFLVPDVGDVITTIQESKAWLGMIRKAPSV